MEHKDKDSWRDLFSAMPDEVLPENFHTKVMYKIKWRDRKRRFWEICGIASGIAVMIITCIIVFYNSDISFKLPEIEIHSWSFPKPDFEVFRSQSFRLSLQVGFIALFLLIIDSTIRRRIEKTNNR